MREREKEIIRSLVRSRESEFVRSFVQVRSRERSFVRSRERESERVYQGGRCLVCLLTVKLGSITISLSYL